MHVPTDEGDCSYPDGAVYVAVDQQWTCSLLVNWVALFEMCLPTVTTQVKYLGMKDDYGAKFVWDL